MTIESQSGWRLNEDMKMSHPVSLGQLRIIISPFWIFGLVLVSAKTGAHHARQVDSQTR